MVCLLILTNHWLAGSAGGLSHSVVTTAENIFKLPPNVTLKQGGRSVPRRYMVPISS